VLSLYQRLSAALAPTVPRSHGRLWQRGWFGPVLLERAHAALLLNSHQDSAAVPAAGGSAAVRVSMRRLTVSMISAAPRAWCLTGISLRNRAAHLREFVQEAAPGTPSGGGGGGGGGGGSSGGVELGTEASSLAVRRRREKEAAQLQSALEIDSLVNHPEVHRCTLPPNVMMVATLVLDPSASSSRPLWLMRIEGRAVGSAAAVLSARCVSAQPKLRRGGVQGGAGPAAELMSGCGRWRWRGRWKKSKHAHITVSTQHDDASHQRR
jgi:hypothetical protein